MRKGVAALGAMTALLAMGTNEGSRPRLELSPSNGRKRWKERKAKLNKIQKCSRKRNRK